MLRSRARGPVWLVHFSFAAARLLHSAGIVHQVLHNPTVRIRADLQALRGIAVLLVVLHHARIPLFQGGYLGVDIFFVISGYLITSLVARDIQTDSFAFAGFYWRRARRLLPAAYAVFAACIALSPFLLTDLEMRDFVKQVLGAVTFTANIALWLQSGYFERAAELKPLLHVWSLSIEEQYYLLLPACLVLVPRRFWLVGAAALTVSSLALCLLTVAANPGEVFYLLPTRAWEMGIGSVLAIWSIRRKEPLEGVSPVNIAAIVALGALATAPLGHGHPGLDALLACVATAALIARPARVLGRGIVARALVWTGDRSYSLYLVHWPIFAFLNSANVGGGGVAWRIRLVAILLSFALAALLYTTIEQRFRIRGQVPLLRQRFAIFVAASLLLLVTAAAIAHWSRSPADYVQRLRANVGLSAECEYTGSFSLKEACRTHSEPRVLVWGDSFAMHLVAGLTAVTPAGLIQATRSTCAPVLGVALYAPPNYATPWANACMEFNDEVLRSLDTEMRSVEIVVLSSQWAYLLSERVQTSGGAAVVSSEAVIVEKMRQTVAAVRAHGKRVVLVSPPPSPGFDAGRCNERLATRKWFFGGSADCDFAYEQSRRGSQRVHALLDRVARESNVGVLSFDAVICDPTENHCASRWDDALLYRDAAHLSYEGSEAIAKRMNLGVVIESLAR